MVIFKKKERMFKIFKKNEYEYYVEFVINLIIITLWFKIRKFNLTNKYNNTIKWFLIFTVPLSFMWLFFSFMPGLIVTSYVLFMIVGLILVVKLCMYIDYDDGYDVVYEYNIDDAKKNINRHKKTIKNKTTTNKVVAEMNVDGSFLEGKDLLRMNKFKNIIR